MGLRYLDGKSWAQVTREERLFCLQLYCRIRERGAQGFIEFLNSRIDARLDLAANWELAYEACFYRDLRHHRGRKGAMISPKRTFDLALLSDDTIVVIEAKANQEFAPDQLKDFALDAERLRSATAVERVLLVGIASSRYVPPQCVRDCFGASMLAWRELAVLYDDELLHRADEIYSPKSGLNFGRNNAGGHMTGLQLMDAHQRGEEFWVGRGGGLNGPRLRRDIISGGWRMQPYQTNRRSAAPSPNWFVLSEFARQIASNDHDA